ncbi:uncharacterized protein LOC128887700 [Hylaeus anthracinus]|uniref:uncharacterized protein LOC128887700 n=1 Tax=Hylaeus anthracinus TaxID=313031 RepID=UPI0023B93253|nr:uncharacterized protein LOC128887700 [Hylaeus anthracinus]
MNEVMSLIPPPAKGFLFADDLTIICKGRNTDTIQEILQQIINKLYDWSNRSGFKFSQIKSEIMIFSRQEKQTHLKLYLGDSELKKTNNVKILGLTFDSKLSWKTHITKLKGECVFRLDILKIIAANNCGADQVTLKNTYQALIRSKLDYGAIIYGCVSHSCLKILDPVHNAALRTIVGAFRTNPILSILKEINDPPLSTRRQILSAGQAIKTSTILNKSAYLNTFSKRSNEKYLQHCNYPKPFYCRIYNIEQKLDIQFSNTDCRRLPKIPPWTIPPIETDITLNAYAKYDTHRDIFISLTNELLNRYMDFTHIYTDGSKNVSSTGYAVVTPQSVTRIKLPDTTSVFTAELMAITHALTLAEKENYLNIAILSDSKSAIASINNTASTNETNLQILEIHAELTNNGNKIVIIWIPSYIGIPGNERADQAAKEAAADLAPNTLTRFHHKDLLNCSKRKLLTKWERKWFNTAPTYIKNLTDNSFQTRRDPEKRSGAEQVIISRLRIGHTKITHSYRLSKEPVHPPVLIVTQ